MAVPAGQAVDATLKGMQNLAKIVPEGGLQTFLKDPIGVTTKAIASLFGKKYSTGEYRLGERFMRHIAETDPGSFRNVPDEIIDPAKYFFTVWLGVDVDRDEDLMALDEGVDAYRARPDKQQVPLAAIQRAVIIKKNNPMSVGNQWKIPWNVTDAFAIPSDPRTMSYHSTVINRDMPISLGTTEDGVSNIDTGASPKVGGLSVWAWLGILLVVGLIIFLVMRARKK